MIPACQRLEAGDRPGLKVDERLEGQAELILLDGTTQFGLEAEAAARMIGLAVAIQFDLPRLLGPLERDLGISQKLPRGVNPLLPHSAPDRAIGANFELRQADRCPQGCLEPVR